MSFLQGSLPGKTNHLRVGPMPSLDGRDKTNSMGSQEMLSLIKLHQGILCFTLQVLHIHSMAFSLTFFMRFMHVSQLCVSCGFSLDLFLTQLFCPIPICFVLFYLNVLYYYSLDASLFSKDLGWIKMEGDVGRNWEEQEEKIP